MKLNKRPLTKRVYIYGLKDPESQEIRYVGKTKHLKARFWRHLHSDEKTHKGCWINCLKRKNLFPILEILEHCLESEWVEREKFWIKHYKDLGNALTNATEGGEGVTKPPGSKLSIEHRQAISNGRKGIKFTEEHKINIGLAQKGRTASEETKIKMSLNSGVKGKPRSEETRLKISQAQKGRKLTEEHKLKLSNARKGKVPWNYGKKATEEHKLKLSIIHKNLYQKKGSAEKQKELVERVQTEGREQVIDKELKKGRLPKPAWALAEQAHDEIWSCAMNLDKDVCMTALDSENVRQWIEDTFKDQTDDMLFAFGLGQLEVFKNMSSLSMKELWERLEERLTGK